MKVSLLGPTNIENLSSIIGLPKNEIQEIAEEIGKILADNKCNLVIFFNYSGILKMVGDSYKKEGGKLEMLYTENDYDWETKIYIKDLKEADIKTKKDSWHDMLLSLVSDSEIVLCAGLSAGVMAELGYMKFNYQENKGKAKLIIGIKELLRDEKFPVEFCDMEKIMKVVSIKELDEIIKNS